MPKRDIAAIESRLREIDNMLSELSRHRARTKELLRIIRQPGWTTPAEFLLSRVVLDSMLLHGGQLVQLSDAFHKGALDIAKRGEKGTGKTAA
jgi:hypothetical protein